jgi:NADH-quinone oxidoreductase subunit M
MLEFFSHHLLSLLLWTPALAAAVLFVLPNRDRVLRVFAIAASVWPLALSVALWIAYDGAAAGFQFEERCTWYAAVGS